MITDNNGAPYFRNTLINTPLPGRYQNTKQAKKAFKKLMIEVLKTTFPIARETKSKNIKPGEKEQEGEYKIDPAENGYGPVYQAR